jgi:DNA-directed RNA polymerase subunit RPC12/RpoP
VPANRPTFVFSRTGLEVVQSSVLPGTGKHPRILVSKDVPLAAHVTTFFGCARCGKEVSHHVIDHGKYLEAVCDECFERDGPIRPRPCECGCGEDLNLAGKRRGAKFLDHAHQMRAQRARTRG